MAAMRATTGTTMFAPSIFRPALHSQTGWGGTHLRVLSGYGVIRCASTKSRDGEKKSPARLAEVRRLLYQAEERYTAGGGVEPVPKITLDHVTISYGRSGGAGGQNFNKVVNTKVEMRFNVKNANWLSERVRERIMQMEKNRINKDGELLISSAKTRSQMSNIEDAMAKLQVFMYQKRKLQAIIDAASYVPPPPSEETGKKIAMLSALGEQKRLEKKKAESQKKVLQRS